MAAPSSALDFGAYPVVGYCDSGHTVGVTLRIAVSVTIRDRARVISGELGSRSRLKLSAKRWVYSQR